MICPDRRKTHFKTGGCYETRCERLSVEAVVRRLAFQCLKVPDLPLKPCLQCRFYFGRRVLTAHAVDRFAIPIQGDKVAGIHFLTERFRNELKKPALRARGSAFNIQTIGTGGRIEKHRNRPPGQSSTVAAALQERQFPLQQIHDFQWGFRHNHLRTSKLALGHLSYLIVGFWPTLLP
jgi:hypothetical protein